MIYMLSAFNLKPDGDFSEFKAAYAAFVADILAAGVIAGAGSVGCRVSDTPMDTDETRVHRYFSVMSFHDRAQLDAAYAHIKAHSNPGTESHLEMYRQLAEPVFLCWEDTDRGLGGQE